MISNNRKIIKKQVNPQKNLKNVENSFDLNINHQHNTKKESLGQNTKH